MDQVRIFPYVAVLIFGLIAWRDAKTAARIIIAAFAGCMLGIAINRGAVREVMRQDIQEGPGKIASNLQALTRQEAFAQFNAHLYDRSRFTGFVEENAVVDSLAKDCGMQAGENVYVLGDDALFYIMLHQQPPFVSNIYNGSPIYEQQKVVDWLERKRPRFVIWDPGDSTFDAVPHVVRVPLIYTWVVTHYEFLRAVGTYQILVERPADHAPDLEYWRRGFGDRVDLGAIPARARASEYEDCPGDTARCDAVLLVKYAQPPASPRKLTVDVGAFQLQFDVNPRQSEYVVNLNRLWFWGPLAKAAPPEVRAEDAAAQTVMTYRRERAPVLY